MEALQSTGCCFQGYLAMGLGGLLLGFMQLFSKGMACTASLLLCDGLCDDLSRL